MLILAATAASEVEARRRNAAGRGFANFGEPGTQQIGFLFECFDQNAFAGQHKWRQHHLAVLPREAVASVNQLFNSDFESFVVGLRLSHRLR